MDSFVRTTMNGELLLVSQIDHLLHECGVFAWVEIRSDIGKGEIAHLDS